MSAPSVATTWPGTRSSPVPGMFMVAALLACEAIVLAVGSRHEVGVPAVAALALSLGCLALLPALAEPMWRSGGMWCLAFILLLGYLGKSVAFGLFNEPLAVFYPELRWLRLEDVVRGLTIIAQAVVGIALGGLLVRALLPGDIRPPPVPAEADPDRVRRLIATLAAIAVLATILPIVLGFGQMGVAVKTLPFRLDLPITRARMSLVPAGLALAHWVALRRGLRREALVSVGLLATVALMDSLVRGSRGSLILFLLPVFLIWVYDGRWTRRKFLALGAAGLAYFALYPILTLLRTSRMLGLSFGAASETAAAAGESAIEGLLGAALLNAATRVSGAEAIWRLAPLDAGTWNWRLLPAFFTDQALARIYTLDIVGVVQEADWRAPTFVGDLLMLGGQPAVLLGSVLLAIVVLLAFRLTARLVVAPVASALLWTFFLVYLSEGGFGVREPIAITLTLVAVTLLWRWLVGAPLRPRATARPGRPSA